MKYIELVAHDRVEQFTCDADKCEWKFIGRLPLKQIPKLVREYTCYTVWMVRESNEYLWENEEESTIYGMQIKIEPKH